jgi:hypothetical protein
MCNGQLTWMRRKGFGLCQETNRSSNGWSTTRSARRGGTGTTGQLNTTPRAGLTHITSPDATLAEFVKG